LLKVAIDTNILAYAEGIEDPTRQAAARRLIQSPDPEAVANPFLPVRHPLLEAVLVG
jgi:predicted nucleic acid-binding protein